MKIEKRLLHTQFQDWLNQQIARHLEAQAARLGADPATATAAFRARVPDFLTARRMHSPTASTSWMFFSATASTGIGSTAWLSTR